MNSLSVQEASWGDLRDKRIRMKKTAKTVGDVGEWGYVALLGEATTVF